LSLFLSQVTEKISFVVSTHPTQVMDSLALAPQVYSRKDKSLGVLVAKYLSLSVYYDSPDFDFSNSRFR
jgi:hypothetical protein